MIPYFLMLICGALPIMLLEIGLGQYMSKGGLKSWVICPLFQGLFSFCFDLVVFVCLFAVGVSSQSKNFTYMETSI